MSQITTPDVTIFHPAVCLPAASSFLVLTDAQVAKIYELIGARIGQLRRQRPQGDMSQSQLAQAVGMSRGSVANIELGSQRPPVHTLWLIARALGVEPRTLLPNDADLEGTNALHQGEGQPLEPSVERVVRELGPGSRQLETWISEARSGITPPQPRARRRRGKP